MGYPDSASFRERIIVGNRQDGAHKKTPPSGAWGWVWREGLADERLDLLSKRDERSYGAQ